MPGPWYVPRKRSRVQSAIPRSAAQDASEGRQVGKLRCSLCYLDLPLVVSGGVVLVQATLGLVCEATPPAICPLSDYLAPRIDESGDPTLSLDRVRSEI